MKIIIKMKIIKVISIVLFTMCYACNKHADSSCASCEEMKILKVLKNEPAFVQPTTFSSIDVRNFFVIELVNSYDGISHGLVRCNNIDLNKYSEQSVEISGNVTNCLVVFDVSSKEIYTYNIIELKSIKQVK
jgi:hypothetical protein